MRLVVAATLRWLAAGSVSRLAAGRVSRLAAVVLVAGSVQACHHTGTTPPTVRQVELHASDPQTLVVVNDLGVPVRLDATGGGMPPSLSPGDRLTQRFVVVSIADLVQPPDVTWYRISPTGRTDYVTDQAPPQVLFTAGRDVELRLRRGDTAAEPLLFSLQGCTTGWSQRPAPPADHVISLADVVATLPGVPRRLCPQ